MTASGPLVVIRPSGLFLTRMPMRVQSNLAYDVCLSQDCMDDIHANVQGSMYAERTTSFVHHRDLLPVWQAPMYSPDEPDSDNKILDANFERKSL